MKDAKIVGIRLKALRDGIKLSQAKLAARFDGVDQASIFRYERGRTFPSYRVLIQYADFFDVSMDYIFGRTDAPQGKLYNYEPQIFKDNVLMQEFIEMCFDPKSSANAKLKEAILKLMEEKNNG